MGLCRVSEFDLVYNDGFYLQWKQNYGGVYGTFVIRPIPKNGILYLNCQAFGGGKAATFASIAAGTRTDNLPLTGWKLHHWSIVNHFVLFMFWVLIKQAHVFLPPYV